MKYERKCEALIWHHYHRLQCDAPAKMQAPDGLFYCGRHDPVKAAAKRKAKYDLEAAQREARDLRDRQRQTRLYATKKLIAEILRLSERDSFLCVPTPER